MKQLNKTPRGLEEIRFTSSKTAKLIDLTAEGEPYERTLHEFVISGTEIHILLKGEFGELTRSVHLSNTDIYVVLHDTNIYIVDIGILKYYCINMHWEIVDTNPNYIFIVGQGELLIVNDKLYKVFEYQNSFDINRYILSPNSFHLFFSHGTECNYNIYEDEYLIEKKMHHELFH